MNTFHNGPFVTSANGQREKGVEPFLCNELNSGYRNRETLNVPWKYEPVLHPVSYTFPKVQRPAMVAEDFLRTGNGPNAFPAKFDLRNPGLAPRSFVENSGSINRDPGGINHLDGRGVPFQGNFNNHQQADYGHGKDERFKLFGTNIRQDSLRFSSEMKHRLPNSLFPNSAGKWTSPPQPHEQSGGVKLRGWGESTTNGLASKVGEGEAQSSEPIRFNQMIQFREKLSLLQQQQLLTKPTHKSVEHQSIQPEKASTFALESHYGGDKLESKISRSYGLESRPLANQNDASLPNLPTAKGVHDPFPCKVLTKEKSENLVGSSQTKSVKGGHSRDQDVPNFCNFIGDKICPRDAGTSAMSSSKLMYTQLGDDPESSFKGASEPINDNKHASSSNRVEGSPDFNYGLANKKRKRADGDQWDDQSDSSKGDGEQMSIKESKVICQTEMADARGTKRQPVGCHGSPEVKKARPCHVPRDPMTSVASSQLPIRMPQGSNKPFGGIKKMPSKYNALSSFICDFYERHQQSKETYVNKIRLRDELYAIMRKVFPYCGLYVIGSSMNGFGSDRSDMDLCLMLSHNEIDQKREATDILRILQKELALCSFLKDIRLIQAKVPILKFTDTISRVECDLNINNSVGIRNTHLLNAYSSLDWRIPPLVLFIKQWAKSWDVNDASRGTISSYSLALMVIHFLQKGCHPHVLPSLQQKYPHKFDEETDVRRLTLNERLAPYESPNNQSLGELFAGFVDYFANKFSFERSAISVRLGQAIPQSMASQFLPKLCNGQWKYICIEEPFNLTNTSYSVFNPRSFFRILDVFKSTDSSLVFGDALLRPSSIVASVEGVDSSGGGVGTVGGVKGRSCKEEDEEEEAEGSRTGTEAATLAAVDVFFPTRVA